MNETTNQEQEVRHTCSICHGYFYGYGNNATPVNPGRCCDYCNAAVVIPARIHDIQHQENP
jgi:hypothetical protein